MFAQTWHHHDHTHSPDPKRLHHFAIFAVILILIAMAVRIILLHGGGANLFPQEAALWLRSVTPAIGSDDGPFLVPMILGLSRFVFGDGEAPLRIPGVLASAIAAWSLYRLGCHLHGERISLWALVLFVTLPLLSFTTAIAGTVPFMLAFWSVALHGFVNALMQNRQAHWLVCGTAMGFAILSDYGALLFPVGMVLFSIFAREYRGLWRKSGPWIALCSALAVTAPHWVWLIQHVDQSQIALVLQVGLTPNPLIGLVMVLIMIAALGPIPVWAALRYIGTLGRSNGTQGAAARGRPTGVAQNTHGYRRHLHMAFGLPALLAILLWAGLTGDIVLSLVAPACISICLMTAAHLIGTLSGRTLLRTSVVLHVIGAILFFNLESGARVAGFRPPPQWDPFLSVRGMDTAGLWGAHLAKQFPDAQMVFDDADVMHVMQFYILPHPLDAQLLPSLPLSPPAAETIVNSLPPLPDGKTSLLLITRTPETAASVMDRADLALKQSAGYLMLEIQDDLWLDLHAFHLVPAESAHAP